MFKCSIEVVNFSLMSGLVGVECMYWCRYEIVFSCCSVWVKTKLSWWKSLVCSANCLRVVGVNFMVSVSRPWSRSVIISFCRMGSWDLFRATRCFMACCCIVGVVFLVFI